MKCLPLPSGTWSTLSRLAAGQEGEEGTTGGGGGGGDAEWNKHVVHLGIVVISGSDVDF